MPNASAASGADAAGGDRPVPGTRHLRVDIAVDVAIQHVGAAGGEHAAEHRDGDQPEGRHTARGHQHGAECRRQQQRHDARLGQGDVVRHDWRARSSGDRARSSPERGIADLPWSACVERRPGAQTSTSADGRRPGALAAITAGGGDHAAGSGRGPQAAKATPSMVIQMSVATTRCGADIQMGSPATAASAFSPLCSDDQQDRGTRQVRAVGDAPRRQASMRRPRRGECAQQRGRAVAEMDDGRGDPCRQRPRRRAATWRRRTRRRRWSMRRK